MGGFSQHRQAVINCRGDPLGLIFICEHSRDAPVFKNKRGPNGDGSVPLPGLTFLIVCAYPRSPFVGGAGDPGVLLVIDSGVRSHYGPFLASVDGQTRRRASPLDVDRQTLGGRLGQLPGVESLPALVAVNRHEEDPCSHNLGRADNLPVYGRVPSLDLPLLLVQLPALQRTLRGLPPSRPWMAIPTLRGILASVIRTHRNLLMIRTLMIVIMILILACFNECLLPSLPEGTTTPRDASLEEDSFLAFDARSTLDRSMRPLLILEAPFLLDQSDTGTALDLFKTNIR